MCVCICALVWLCLCVSFCLSVCVSQSVCLCRSPAAIDGRISVGDVIVEVNAVSLELMSDAEAVNTLRDAVRNCRYLADY